MFSIRGSTQIGFPCCFFVSGRDGYKFTDFRLVDYCDNKMCGDIKSMVEEVSCHRTFYSTSTL